MNGFQVMKIHNPQTAVQKAMYPVLPKRFYQQVSVVEELVDQKNASGEKMLFAIHLDGKKLKTPARNTLFFPSQTAARIIADEWSAQKEYINPAAMPATRLANTACDGVANDPQAVIEDLLKLSASDLLCYRALKPEGLVERQICYWDPILEWIEKEMSVRFEVTHGLIQIRQSKEAIAAVGIALKQWQDPIELAALHSFATLTASVILALAVVRKRVTAYEAWNIAHVDEDWNIALWGDDDEARQRRKNRWKEMEAASHLFMAI